MFRLLILYCLTRPRGTRSCKETEPGQLTQLAKGMPYAMGHHAEKILKNRGAATAQGLAGYPSAGGEQL